MKRWLILLTALLVLTGCAAEPEDTMPITTEATEDVTIDVTEPPTEAEPTGFYDPDSMVEIATTGAVQVYPLYRTDCNCVIPMGDDLLLLSGTESTTLTLLTGDTLCAAKSITVDCAIDPESPALRVSAKSVIYYDDASRELVFLDRTLKEVSRNAMPEEIIGTPMLSADTQTIYYCTADSLRSIDRKTGLDKLLKEMSYSCRTLNGLHCGDSILECAASDDDGNLMTLYLSTETGETLWLMSGEIKLWTSDERYFALHYDGAYPELITGTGQNEVYLLNSPDAFAAAAPIQNLNGVILASTSDDENTSRLDCFDLESGTLTASVTIPGSTAIRNIQEDDDGTYIWFLRYDSSYDSDVLCRWNPSQNQISDDTSHLAQRYNAQNPDLEGLDRCAETAAALSEKYGVEILTWTDAAACQTDDDTLTMEYQVPLIEHSLRQLDTALSRYPDDFLKKAASGTNSGVLKICLVRSVGTGENALQYWTNDSACIALCPDQNLEQNFHHQLFYILENRVLSTCSIYDSWSSLNPKGFSYDLDYEAAAARTDVQWIEGDSRAFIDYDSMSFPRVDRARIMEYAMMPGNRSCFESDTMQQKLRKLCLGIREAFELKDSTETFRWEQYLADPLNQ